MNRGISLYPRRTVSHRAVLLAAGIWFLPGSAASAAVLDVAAGEVVAADNGLCSLREALSNAETDTQADNDDCPAGSGPDVLELAAGSTYTLPNADPAGPTSANGLRVVTTEITVDGNGSTIERDGSLTCTIDGVGAINDEFRILAVGPSGDLTLNDLILRNGCADGPGGFDDGGAVAIVDATLALNRVTVTLNRAQDKSGGVDTGGSSTATIVDSTFTFNSSEGGGGGIGNGPGSIMTIEGSTIRSNTALGLGGGGIGNFGFLTIRNSTIASNVEFSGIGGGGGIGNTGTVELVHSTVVENGATGPLDGGGIGNAGTISIKNSIVANSVAGGDCVNLDTFSAVGANFDTDGTCAAIDADFIQVTPVQLALGPIADNGGPTESAALLPGSVALDAATDCTLLDGATPVTEDQRDVSRPQGPSCDSGSFELVQGSFVAEIPALDWRGLLLLSAALAGLAAWRLRR